MEDHECTKFGDWEVHEDYRLRVCTECGELDIDEPYYEDDDDADIDDHYEIPDLPEPCPVCDGDGVVVVEWDSGVYENVERVCPECQGTGYAP